MSTFAPENIPSSADVLSSPLRNNFNKLQTLLNSGLGDDQFADNTLSGLKLADGTVTATKCAQTGWTLTGSNITPTSVSTGALTATGIVNFGGASQTMYIPKSTSGGSGNVQLMFLSDGGTNPSSSYLRIWYNGHLYNFTPSSIS
jgi:hypothetical protein